MVTEPLTHWWKSDNIYIFAELRTGCLWGHSKKKSYIAAHVISINRHPHMDADGQIRIRQQLMGSTLLLMQIEYFLPLQLHIKSTQLTKNELMLKFWKSNSHGLKGDRLSPSGRQTTPWEWDPTINNLAILWLAKVARHRLESLKSENRAKNSRSFLSDHFNYITLKGYYGTFVRWCQK